MLAKQSTRWIQVVCAFMLALFPQLVIPGLTPLACHTRPLTPPACHTRSLTPLACHTQPLTPLACHTQPLTSPACHTRPLRPLACHTRSLTPPFYGRYAIRAPSCPALLTPASSKELLQFYEHLRTMSVGLSNKMCRALYFFCFRIASTWLSHCLVARMQGHIGLGGTAL